LQQEGYDCTIFDDHPQPGGMLRYEIPPEQLPRIILDSEINIILKLGAAFRLDTEVGVDIPLETLEKDFDAVILATGTPPPKEWDRPGIFICGGAVKLVNMAVKSAARGRAAAFLVSRYLAGREKTASPGQEFQSRLGKLKEGEVEEFLKTMDKDKTGDMFLLNGCSTENITSEAKRCLHCECGKSESCKLRRFAGEYKAAPKRFNGNGRKRVEKVLYPAGVVHEPGKCIKCGLCVRISLKYGEPLGFTFIGRGFDVKIGMPVNGNSHKASAKVAALCIEACPTGALSSSTIDKSFAGVQGAVFQKSPLAAGGTTRRVGPMNNET
jgi:ferredoxin